MTTLRLSRTHYPVTALGPGNRLGVWLQGCSLSCRGCMSQDTWDSAGGLEVGVGDLVRRWRVAVENGADGLTVSGGEPLQQPDGLREFLAGADEVRREADRDIDILLYTGYEPAELDDERWRAAEFADVLIAGRYDVTQPTALIWRGSANQRMLIRTELGRRRYVDHVDHEPERTPIQVRSDAAGVWLIGTPRRGGLTGLEKRLRADGLEIEDVSWRRRRAGG